MLAARIASLANQVRILEAQTSRYRRLTQAGATAPGDLDDREIQLVSRRLQLSEARAELTKLDTELVQSELRSPIDGLVLRIHTQPGERPGSSGILELGANQNMEAVAEVYESDIAQVRIGQRVRIKSETGGFKGDLQGRVLRISPQVQQRKVLSSDPSAAFRPRAAAAAQRGVWCSDREPGPAPVSPRVSRPLVSRRERL